MQSKVLLLILCMTTAQSCTYGYSGQTDIAYQAAYTYKPHTRYVEVFFDDVKPVRAYRQLALIEIDGAAQHSNNDLLIKVRKRAQEIGADAVIGLRKSTMTRERGSLVGDILFSDPDDQPDTYVSSVFTCVAIKYLD